MVATTATWLLPYQQGTDRGCDYAGVWCDFVELVDTIMSDIQDVLSLGRALPAAKIYNDSTITPTLTAGVTDFGPLPMAVEQLDTNNMVNLTIDTSAITPTRNGRYIALGYEEWNSVGGTIATAAFLGALQDVWQTVDTDTTSIVGTNDPNMAFTGGFQWSPGVDGVAIAATHGLGTPIVLRMELFMLWIGDL
jgi:hypothetical protein